MSMSLIDATKSLIDTMSEDELLEIYHQARNIIDQRSNPFRPLTKQQILADLATSRKQIEDGEYLDFEDAINEIEAQYGL